MLRRILRKAAGNVPLSWPVSVRPSPPPPPARRIHDDVCGRPERRRPLCEPVRCRPGPVRTAAKGAAHFTALSLILMEGWVCGERAWGRKAVSTCRRTVRTLCLRVSADVSPLLLSSETSAKIQPTTCTYLGLRLPEPSAALLCNVIPFFWNIRILRY
jgi:hypothetical protein